MHDFEGKKLMIETFYLYGCMLLLLDRLIIGPVREKIMIAYYRYKVNCSKLKNLFKRVVPQQFPILMKL